MISIIIYFLSFSISIFIAYLYSKFNNENFSFKLRTYSIPKKYNSLIWFFLIFFLPILISGCRVNVGTDYSTYNELYQILRYEGFVFSNYPIEIGFKFICFISYVIFDSSRTMFIITSIIPLAIIFYGHKKFYKSFSLASILIFYYGILYGVGLNNVRQIIAIAILFYAFHYLINKKKIAYCICIAVATLFHNSSLVCLFFIVFTIPFPKRINKYKNWIIYFLLLLVSVFMADLVNILKELPIFDVYFTRYSIESYSIYKNILVKLTLIIPLLFIRKDICKDNNYLEVIFYIMLCEPFFLSLANSFKWAFRLAYYTLPACMLIYGKIFTIKKPSLKIKCFQKYLVLWAIVYFLVIFWRSQNDAIFPYLAIFNFF